MTRDKTRWGLPFPIAAAVLLGGMLYFVVTRRVGSGSVFMRSVVPWTGIVLSLACFLVGHLSYPRIHNLKVYLSGYLMGLTGLGYFLVVAHPRALAFIPGRTGFATALYVLVFSNLLAVTLVPQFMKYHVTKYITWAVTGVELLILVLAEAFPWLEKLAGLREHVWLGGVLAAVLVGSTIRFMRGQFHLGGVMCATALFYGVSWVCPIRESDCGYAEPLFVATSVLFFEVGILFHWFVRMEHRIAYDPLLHIYNREYCSRILAEQSKLNASPPFTIAMVDIDHFKKVNDTYGHQAGDQILYAVAQTISRVVVPEGTLCRYGGEELAVFFPGGTSKDVKKVMEEARKAVAKVKVASGKKQIGVTVSCGISTRTDSSQPLQTVLKNADKALYRAKDNGRNQVRVSATRARKR